MARKTDRWESTSFHQTTIRTSPQRLINTLGKPQHFQNDGMDKSNMDWICETDDGEIFFTIYDWKEGRPLSMSQTYEFHIGGHSRYETEEAKRELISMGI